MTGRAKTVGQIVALGAVAGLLVLLVWKLAFGNGGGAASELAKGKHPVAPGVHAQPARRQPTASCRSPT